MLLVAGLTATVIFVVFGLYALAGAGYIPPLPVLRLGLLGIGIVYSFRGLLVIPLLLIMAGILKSSETIPPQALTSSLLSLLIGVVYLAGTTLGWHELPSRSEAKAG